MTDFRAGGAFLPPSPYLWAAPKRPILNRVKHQNTFILFLLFQIMFDEEPCMNHVKQKWLIIWIIIITTTISPFRKECWKCHVIWLRGHTFMMSRKNDQLCDTPHLPYPQKWAIDLLFKSNRIPKHVKNFKILCGRHKCVVSNRFNFSEAKTFFKISVCFSLYYGWKWILVKVYRIFLRINKSILTLCEFADVGLSKKQSRKLAEPWSILVLNTKVN